MTAMQKLIIGNWKANKSEQEARSWLEAFKQSGVLSELKQVLPVLCPPAMYLPLCASLMPELVRGAQTVSSYPNGAYTGAISAAQLAQYATYAILGHAERRQYFGETDQNVAQQVRQCLEVGITPIVAVEAKSVLRQLSLFEATELARIVVMYEPAEAISTMGGSDGAGGGHAVVAKEVAAAIAALRQEFAVRAVLYGGSVSAENVAEYMAQPEIDGVVPGAASLEVEEFVKLVKIANNANIR